jgi:hypothetical protein
MLLGLSETEVEEWAIREEVFAKRVLTPFTPALRDSYPAPDWTVIKKYHVLNHASVHMHVLVE